MLLVPVNFYSGLRSSRKKASYFLSDDRNSLTIQVSLSLHFKATFMKRAIQFSALLEVSEL